MKYNMFPGTQERVSAIGLGTWVFGAENWNGAKEEDSIAAIHKAIEIGMTFIDTAPFYGDGSSERLIGQAIKGQREKVFIATKCGIVRENGRIKIDLSPYSIFKEIDLSLGRLQCEVIDLYQCHWPDENTPVEKTMEVLAKLKELGKIRHIGVSNFGLALLKKTIKAAPIRTLQSSYSLLDRAIEDELLPFCRENGIGVITYGSMGGGILTGKYAAPPSFSKVDARKMFYKYYEGGRFKSTQAGIEKLKEIGRPLNQLALNWVRQQPGVMTVLAGCRTPDQVIGNAAAADWELSGEEVHRISRIAF